MADEPASHPSSEAPAASSDAPAASYVAVDLTPSGTFGRAPLSGRKSGSRVQLVRGYAGMEYHADVFDAALPAIEASGLTDVTCTGGGRIRHDAGSKLFIYGYSLGFGRADHATTEALCRKAYPSYEISWSNDGY